MRIRIFLPENTRSLNHIAEREQSFGPCPGFKAAIGIHPELFRRDESQSLFEVFQHFFEAWNAGAVDVVDAGADGTRIFEVHKGLQQLHVASAGFNADDVGVHLRDPFQDGVKLAVAHMRVDLRRIPDSGNSQAKGVDGPAQIFFRLLLPEG